MATYVTLVDLLQPSVLLSVIGFFTFFVLDRLGVRMRQDGITGVRSGRGTGSASGESQRDSQECGAANHRAQS